MYMKGYRCDDVISTKVRLFLILTGAFLMIYVTSVCKSCSIAVVLCESLLEVGSSDLSGTNGIGNGLMYQT